MRTIHRYIAGSFALTFVVTISVITFVMTIGVAFRVTDLLARGVSASLIGEILLYGVPPAMAFSIPMSVLTACLLVFGRLSADGEITAMKASGLSTWQIISTILLFAVFLSFTCLYINNELAPESHYRRKNIFSGAEAINPIQLLDSGRFINLPDFTMYIGDKNENELLNVRIYQSDPSGKKKELRAERASVRLAENGKDLILTMKEVRIDPVVDGKRVFIGEMELPVKNVFKGKKRAKKEEDMTLAELLVMIRKPAYEGMKPEKVLEKRMELKVEFNKRLVLSASCFAFVMIGIPLGIKAHRKESSIGIAISLLLVTLFYLFIIIAESLAEQPALRPDIIVWLPVIISVTLGSWLIRRSN